MVMAWNTAGDFSSVVDTLEPLILVRRTSADELPIPRAWRFADQTAESDTADGLVRRATHRRLEREVRRLHRAGTEVVGIEPSARVLRAMGLNAMADDRSDRVVQAAFLDTGRHTARPDVARRLAPLSARATERTRDALLAV